MHRSGHGFASFDRTLIQLPAFRRAGVQHWAAFSRKPDLGNRALFWYPTLAMAGTAMSIGAALEGRSKNVSRGRAACLFTAAALAAAGLLTTIGAAPKMLRLRRIGDDEAEQQRSFDGFVYWQTISRNTAVIGVRGKRADIALVRGGEDAAWPAGGTPAFRRQECHPPK